MALCGLVLAAMNEAVVRLIRWAARQEKEIYATREELSVLRRSLVFLTLNLICLLVLNIEIYGLNLGKILVSINSDW
jgi:hypothetical protein